MENKTTSIQKTSGIQLKDKIGYALGDVGSVCVLGLVNSILQKFYTDELGFSPALLIWMFLFARIFDAAIDPFWATIVDNKKENEDDITNSQIEIVATEGLTGKVILIGIGILAIIIVGVILIKKFVL